MYHNKIGPIKVEKHRQKQFYSTKWSGLFFFLLNKWSGLLMNKNSSITRFALVTFFFSGQSVVLSLNLYSPHRTKIVQILNFLIACGGGTCFLHKIFHDYVALWCEVILLIWPFHISNTILIIICLFNQVKVW